MDPQPPVSQIGMQAIHAALQRRAQGQTIGQTTATATPQPMPSGMPGSPVSPTPQAAPMPASQMPQQNLGKAPVNNMQQDPTQDNATKSLKQAVNLLGTPGIDDQTKAINKALVQRLLNYH